MKQQRGAGVDAHPRSSVAWARLRRADGDTVLLTVGGSVAPGDVAWLCERVRVVLERARDAALVCDVEHVTDVELGTVDVLARVALVARRLGRPFRLRSVSTELAEVLGCAG